MLYITSPELLISSFDFHFSNERCWTSFHIKLSVFFGQGGLVCCSPWGRKESDTTERELNCHLWRNMCLSLLLTFWPGCLFFWYWAAWATCIFWRLILCQLFHLLFVPSWRLSFHLAYSFLCCETASKFN